MDHFTHHNIYYRLVGWCQSHFFMIFLTISRIINLYILYKSKYAACAWKPIKGIIFLAKLFIRLTHVKKSFLSISHPYYLDLIYLEAWLFLMLLSKPDTCLTWFSTHNCSVFLCLREFLILLVHSHIEVARTVES